MEYTYGTVPQTTLAIINDMPLDAQRASDDLRVIHPNSKSRTTFLDRHGRYVEPTRPLDEYGRNTTPYFDLGYYKCLWELRCGHIAKDETTGTLYIRDTTPTAQLSQPNSWHQCSSIENEYHIKQTSRIHSFQPMIEQTVTQTIRRGCKINNTSWWRNEQGIQVSTSDTTTNYIYSIDDPNMTNNTMEQLMNQAIHWCEWLTQDAASASNLIRMFATPFLEPYKHLTYIMAGRGGNGKGIITHMLADHKPHMVTQFSTKDFSTANGFTQQQEASKLFGKWWAVDEEADELTPKLMSNIKRLSTGDTLSARNIGENTFTFTPTATLIICTNNPVTYDLTEASSRRFVNIKMVDGRKPEDFDQLRAFITKYGATPFMFASIIEWQAEGDNPRTDVTLSDPDQLTDYEGWIVTQICENGYAVPQSNPFKTTIDRATRGIYPKLGLESKVRKINGVNVRVVIVKDELKFKPFRDDYMANKDIEISTPQQSSKHFTSQPLDSVDMRPMKAPTLDQLPIAPVQYSMEEELEQGHPISVSYKGLPLHVVPCGQNPNNPKAAIGWKQYLQNTPTDTITIGRNQTFAVIPDKGMLILDMDNPKNEDGEHGYDTITKAVGALDTMMVKTPNNGLHAYYRIPEKWQGTIKDSNHKTGQNGKQLNVDVKCENMGYVLGAGSSINGKYYQWIDSANKDIAILPDKLYEWLMEHGYTKNSHPSTVRQQPSLLATVQQTNNYDYTPQLDAIPEGVRNNTLYAWGYGRLKNHPENKLQIEQDLYQRAHSSGISDSETATIWRSIQNSVLH